MAHEWLTVWVVSAAGFFAGALNAMAGGGSFLTLPALIAVGVAPVSANATGTFALLPGYISGAWGFRDLMRASPGLSMRMLVAVSAIGGALGASLLLITPNESFRMLVPWLLLIATVLFAVGPKLLVRAKVRHGAYSENPRGPWAILGLLVVCVYGGYFNGGLGIVLLALLRFLGEEDLAVSNGLKNLISALLTAIAVALYAWGGAIAWSESLPMAVSATVGGYAGARFARRLPSTVLRYGIVAVGAIMTVLFFASS